MVGGSKTVKVRRTYRLRPSKTARKALVEQFGASRFVWNHLVAESRRRFEQCPEQIFGFAQQARELTRLRAEVTDQDGEHWLAKLPSVPQQQMVRSFAKARTKALLDRKNKVPLSKRTGLPQFKSRHKSRVSLNYTLRGFGFTEVEDQGVVRVRLRLAGGVVIPVVWSTPPVTTATSVTVFEDNLGHWWASFVVEEELAPTKDPNFPEVVSIGVDWGVKETATTASRTGNVLSISDRFDLPNARRSLQAQKEVTRLQRKMARRKRPKGQDRTKGYATAKRQTAKAIKRAANQRKDDAHQWAAKLTKAATNLAVEDFHPGFMSKTTLARSAQDGAVAAAKQALLWHAQKRGTNVKLINPKHTTMDCSNCGARAKPLNLSQRTYLCQSCNTQIDRDKNAAINMLNRAGLNPVCADGIRPKPTATWALAA